MAQTALRLNRSTFIVGMLIVILYFVLLILMLKWLLPDKSYWHIRNGRDFTSNFPLTVLSIPGIIFVLSYIIRRRNDYGDRPLTSGFLTGLFELILYPLLIALRPGEKKTNKCGPPPRKGVQWKDLKLDIQFG